MERRRLMIEWLLIALVASLIVIGAFTSGVTRPVDNVIYDYIAPARAAPPDDRIIVVDIDNGTLSEIGHWPWPRTVHAAAIDRLRVAGAKVLIYDILFIEPTPDDERLAQSLRNRQLPVVLPMLVETPGANGAIFQFRPPTGTIARTAAGIGAANLPIDPDGRVRRVELAAPDSQQMVPHVAELAYRIGMGHPSPAFGRINGDDPTVLMPTNHQGAFRTVSFGAMLRGEVPDRFFANKYVLVGASAEGLGDRHPVFAARSGQMAGTELQANLLNSLLADRFIREASPRWVLVASLAPLWLLLIAFWRLTPESSLNLSLGLLVAVLAGDVALLALGGLWLPPVAALLGLILVYPLWGWRRLAAISRFMVTEVDRLRSASNIADLPEPGWRAGDRVAGEAEQLHSLIGMIRQNAQEREEMLQFLSHDMRSPQSAIMALTETMQPSAAEQEKVSRIRRHASHTLRLADDFVQLARLQARPLAHDPVDLADAVAQAADMVWSAARARGVTIQRQPPLDDVWVAGDDAALVRAFTNLLDNAIRFSPRGGVVEYRVWLEDGRARAHVMDRGPGLPPDRRGNPFARFGSVDHHGDPDLGHGAGLGLAYVKGAVEQLGGTVAYRDRRGGGAIFTLHLPLEE